MDLGLNPENAMEFWLWSGRLWPIILTLIFLYLRRKLIANKIGFFIIGVLVCFGVQWVVGQFSLLMPVSYTGEQGSPEQIFSMALNSLARAVIVSMILGSIALWVFSKIEIIKLIHKVN
ncbi:MAG: hypothetical protein LPH21_06390 [Shewanella sp.]|nr:hypothetical protein [Shewanella sp.]